MRWWASLLIVLGLIALGAGGGVPRAPAASAQAATASAAADAPLAYTSDGKIVFPKDYRSWAYLTTGLAMSYSPRTQPNGQPFFDNVFVTPAAYRAFTETGHWPDKTVFVIEVRASREKGSINKSGHFQGDVAGYDVEVRDDARFPNENWKWTAFDAPDAVGAVAPAQAFPKTAACFQCHNANAAVDKSFVQFYPTLLPIARAKGTLNAAYVAAEHAGGS
jgi:hypothetical protein